MGVSPRVSAAGSIAPVMISLITARPRSQPQQTDGPVTAHRSAPLRRPRRRVPFSLSSALIASLPTVALLVTSVYSRPARYTTKRMTEISRLIPLSGALKRKTAGMTSPNAASISRAQFIWAALGSNDCLRYLSPPANIARPRPKSRLPTIEPVSDALTIGTRP